MSAAKDGDWYVYTGEEKDAIAVAMHGRGKNGGWMGIALATMAMPSEHKTQEQINAAAKLMAAAPDLLAALKAIVNSDMAMREEDEGRQSRDLSIARAAIAKATGAA